MKIIALVFTLALASVYQLQAQDDQKTEVAAQDNKELIQKEDLPEVVIQEFEKSVYKQWTIDKVYKVEASNEVSYELHLSQPGQPGQPGESMVLVADAQGQLEPKAEG